MNTSAQVSFELNQKAYMVVVGNGEKAQLPIHKGHLLVFESLLHAGPVAQSLVERGIIAQVIPMDLGVLCCLAEGQHLGLWMTRYDGTLVSIGKIAWGNDV